MSKFSPQDELFVRRLEVWQRLLRVGDVARGSVVILRRPCKRPGCAKCAAGGERHPATYLGYRQKGKLHWLYLPKELVPRAKQWVSNYRALEGLLQELSQTNVQILRLWAREKSQKKPGARRQGGSGQ